ncbi:MAG TPA: MarR family transcriptional regulator [Rhodospirillaceae bacterium]|nr:MarR family transcriptional regulator [Rhodospirillaceae bacterium]
MTDIKSEVDGLCREEEDLRQGIELLYFAYREFTAEPDAILAQLGLGRAHHRAIYFIGRRAGITVSELLATLRITKQSLSRVLKQLLQGGFVIQAAGASDRRQRLLRLTDKGIELERRLTEAQRNRIAKAYREAGDEAVTGFRQVLTGLLDAADRRRFVGATKRSQA